MMSQIMPCNVSACFLSIVDQKGFCFNNDLCDANGYITRADLLAYTFWLYCTVPGAG